MSNDDGSAHCDGDPEIDQRNAAIVSPGAIMDEIETARGKIRELDSDIQTSTVATDFKAAWHVYVDEFYQFYEAHLGWWSRWWYASYEKAIEYRRRTADWREKFVKLGGVASAPADHVPGETTDQLLSLGKGLLLCGALVLGIRLIQSLRAPTPAPAEAPPDSSSTPPTVRA